jgi:3-polyprenyl-4-hydroxybenzoate decarboxylase
MNDRSMVEAMRQALATFKGHAIVNRVYEQFTLSYHYEHGAVVRIVEQNDEREKMIFERLHQHGEAVPYATACSTTDRLEAVFQRNDVEIDQQLARIHKQLVACEAIAV